MHRVAVLLIPPVIAFDATIAPMLFGYATDADGNPLYEVVTCGVDGEPVHSTNGFAIVPAAGPEALASADTVVVPGTTYAAARQDGVLEEDVSAALARIPAGTRLVSICTGAFVLAAAGLLDGRPATTHWRWADELRRLHPKIAVDENVLFVDDGICSPRRGSRRESTCACTSSGPITVPGWPTRWRATASCRHGVRAGRRSSSTADSLSPSRPPHPRPGRVNGRSTGCTRNSPSSDSPATRT